MKRSILTLFLIGFAAIALGISIWLFSSKPVPILSFNGEKALQDVIHQVEFGPRIPGSPAHAQIVDWIVSELTLAGWDAEVLEQPISGRIARNVIARRGTGPLLILGAHYDSRQFADQDPNPTKRTEPVPGANDGASGVAVLLELARSLPQDNENEIWLVFFDLEDQGGIEGKDWIEGSTAFAQSMTRKPEAVVIIDMIGDANLDVYYERFSDRNLSIEVWEIAKNLGYADKLISSYKWSIYDDHKPFLDKGYPAIDIIDFDYPYWHTTADTPDKVSAESLDIIGETLWHWIVGEEE